MRVPNVLRPLFTAVVAFCLNACVPPGECEGEGEGEGEGEDPCLPPAIVDSAFVVAGDCDVELVDGVTVAAAGTLRIEAGATLRFPAGRTLQVQPEGTLIAIGTAEAPIVLRGTTADWIGVDVESGSADNALTFVSVERGGGGANLFGREAALQVREAGRLAVTDVGIVDAAGAGIAFFAGADATLTRVTVSGAAGAAAVVDAAAAHLLNSTVVFAGDVANGTQRVVVEPTAFTRDATWSALDVPYELTGELSLDARLTLSPGVIVLGRSGARVIANPDGALSAVGTAASKILFGPVQVGNTFGGLVFFSNTIDNTLSFVDVNDAGEGAVLFQPAPGAVYVASGARVAIDNATINDAEGFALVLGEEDIDLALTNSTFAGSADGAVTLRANELVQLSETNSYGGTIEVRTGDARDAGTWANLGVTVNFAETVDVNADIVVADGADLAFASDTALHVIDGTLSVLDTTAELQTQLRGQEPTAGFWSGVVFDSASANNILDGARLSDAGGAPVLFAEPSGVFVFNGATATVTDCAFSNIDGDGIYVDAGGAVVQSNNTFVGVAGQELVDENP
jgi:hypothetical protein